MGGQCTGKQINAQDLKTFLNAMYEVTCALL